MDQITHMLIEGVITLLGMAIMYFLKRRDDEQEEKIKEMKRTIADLYEKHNADVAKLHEVQLTVVKISTDTDHLDKALGDIKKEIQNVGEAINYIRERMDGR